MTEIENLSAQNGQTVTQRTIVLKHPDRSPVCDPQGAAEHGGTMGTENERV